MRLLIIDGSNVVMRCAWGGDVPHLVVALDCPGVPCWRVAEYAEYKANRERDTSPWLRAAHAAWSREGLWVEAVGGFEADDVMATVAMRAKDRGTVMVLSGDSDVLPLLAEGVQIVKPLDGGLFAGITAEGVRMKYKGLVPEQLVDLKAMTGETGDNVPGVDGVGLVRGAQLLHAHGTLEGVIEAGEYATNRWAMKVRAAAETCRLAKRLVTLRRDVPVVPISPSACAV